MGERISLEPGSDTTLNLGRGCCDNGYNGGGMNQHGLSAGGGFVGGAILGGGAGYILSREVGDLKGRIGDMNANIKESQASVEKEIAGVTMNLKDQICATEKLVTSESQRVTGTIGAVNDVMQAKFATQNDLINSLSRDTERSIAAVLGQQKDCCCELKQQLQALECCCEKTQAQITCLEKDIMNQFVIQSKDCEIQRLKDLHEQDRRFCALEKGQQSIIDILNNDRAIDRAKSEAVKDFQTNQLFEKMQQCCCAMGVK